MTNFATGMQMSLYKERTPETGISRTLYFHTGTHKTGSTALQAYLATNKAILHEVGVSYEHPAGTYQTMGNGQHLYEKVYEHCINENQLVELLEFYFSGRQKAICSSEDFSRFKLKDWQKVKDVCQRLHVQVKFVTFVRDISSYYFSLHGQLIKSGVISVAFDEFCKHNQLSPVLDSLKCLLSLFGRESMFVIHYESAINILDKYFMSAIGLNPVHFDRSPLGNRINRSLIEYEQEIMSRITNATGQQYSYELSDLLMTQRPHLIPAKQINEKTIAKLSSRHAVDVEWLNQTFFDNHEVVKISKGAVGKFQQEELSPEDRQAIDRDLVNWCISKFQTVQQESIEYVAERLYAIDWVNASKSIVPEDFDPIAYLLLNADVLKSSLGPYEHFISSGQYEGRRWKWASRYHEFSRAKNALQGARPFPLAEADRVRMTIGCNDCANLPKVPNAGSSFIENGQLLQQMHDGTRVVAGGYFGEWMRAVIQQLQGHHEPQEESLFHTLLKHARPGSLMVELGCFWAYYSNWYLGAVPLSKAMCIEPDEARLRVGQQNMLLNQRTATFHLAAAGGQFQAEQAFVRESDGVSVVVPVWDFAKLLEQVGADPIELLHMDTQGAELPFLESIARTAYHDRLRFVVVSTHHASISGSTTTHRDCLATLIDMGAFILCEHKVEESFSGDGLIVASFNADDARIPMPSISRNKPENSLFGPDPKREVKLGAKEWTASQAPVLSHELADQIEVVQTAAGPMRIFRDDAVIGVALKSTGTFQTEKIDEVSTFLRERFKFTSELFVDIGANIGTHSVHALKSGGFKRGLAFEPDPANYALLAQNISLAGLSDKVKAFKLALSSRSGAATFELCGSNFGDHRVRVDGAQPRKTFDENQRRLISVLADTGSEFFEENALTLSAETLIWVDTQGHEGHVFTGLSNLLAGVEKPFVVCEFWPYGLERALGKEMFFNFMRSCKVFYDINQPNWQKHPQIKLEKLESMYQLFLSDTQEGHYPHTDLLCVL